MEWFSCDATMIYENRSLNVLLSNISINKRKYHKLMVNLNMVPRLTKCIFLAENLKYEPTLTDRTINNVANYSSI